MLESLERSGILQGFGSSTGPAVIPKAYYTFGNLTHGQARGDLAFASTFGAPLIVPTFAAATVVVTGENHHGEPGIGSGLIVSDRHLLTCAHVVNDLRLDERLTLPTVQPPIVWGPPPPSDVGVVRYVAHESVDVAVVEVEPALSPRGGLTFRDPEWADDVTIYGFPACPFGEEQTL